MTKENCTYCELIKTKKNMIYEDDLVFAFLNEKPASDAHIVVIPKEHFPILELIPDQTFQQIFKVANRLSVAVFDTMKVGGTNIVIANGVAAGQTIPHASLHIIPRNENDGLNFEWQPKQLTQEEMSTVELKLKEAFSEKPQETKTPLEKKKQPALSDPENYMIRALNRIP